jgi:hypothetical protein
MESVAIIDVSGRVKIIMQREVFAVKSRVTRNDPSLDQPFSRYFAHRGITGGGGPMRDTLLIRPTVVLVLLGVSLMSSIAQAASRNQVVGTWRMVSAQIEKDGKPAPAYGRPNGLLIFAPDMHYVEVLSDADVPRFASDALGQGTAAENRTAMAKSIGMFGTYTVDENGEFTGDRVEGSTFPNWIGDVRTRDNLSIVVDGDRMTDKFTRPDGSKITIIFERVR